MKKLKKLLICIGAQKAGTTWLHEVLATDQRLKTPSFCKEVQYFNYKYGNCPLINQWRAHWLTSLAKKEGFKGALTHYLQPEMPKKKLSSVDKIMSKRISFCLNPLTDDWYSDYMALGPKKHCAVDVSPEYALVGQVGFENMSAITEDLKLVLILRDPVERSWSGMIQELKHKPDAEALLAQLANASIEDLVKRAHRPNIHKRSDYLPTFTAVKAAGLEDRLKVVFHDDIVARPAQVLAKIYAHIDLPLPEMQNELLEKVIHKSPSIKMPQEFRQEMKAVYVPMLAQINAEFVNLPPIWKRRYGL